MICTGACGTAGWQRGGCRSRWRSGLGSAQQRAQRRTVDLESRLVTLPDRLVGALGALRGELLLEREHAMQRAIVCRLAM